MSVLTANRLSIRQVDFSGGQNSGDETKVLAENQAEVLENSILSKKGKCDQRKGLTRLGDNPDTLISLWTFDDSSSVDDKESNDGTDSSVTYTAGKFGQCASFNGTTSSILVAYNSTIDITSMGACRISAWVYVDSDGENDEGRIVDKWSGTKVGYRLYVFGESSSTVKLKFEVGYGTTNAYVETSTTLSTGAWHKVDAIHNSDKSLDLYIDGAIATYGTDTTGVGTIGDDSAVNLYFGNNSAGSSAFDGELDDIRIYDGAFTADDLEIDSIKGLYHFQVGSTIDTLVRVKDTQAQRLSTDYKQWENITGITTLTADTVTNFCQATDQLFIINGTGNVYSIDSSGALLKRIGSASMTSGSGLNDLTSSGTYTGSADAVFTVEVDGVASGNITGFGQITSSTVRVTSDGNSLSDGETIIISGSTSYNGTVSISGSKAGTTGNITAFAEGSTGHVEVTSASHGLANGEQVVIIGTTNYNGTFIVSDCSTDTFEILDTWISDDGTGTWTSRDSFIINDTFVYEELSGSYERTPNTFRWKKDSGAYTSLVAMTGSAQTLSDGVTVTFTAVTGHTYGNVWTFTAYISEGSDNAACPKGTFAEWASNNRMFVSGSLTESERDCVWFSNSLDPHTYNRSTNLFKVRSGSGGKVTWLKMFKENELIIYKNDSVYVLDMSGTAPLTDWEVKPLSISVGCPAGRTVCDIGNDHIFLANDGVRLLSRTQFDKLRVGVISEPIKDIIDSINQDAISTSCAWFENGIYILGIPVGTSTYPNKFLLWDSLAAQRNGNPSQAWTVVPTNNWTLSCLSSFGIGDNIKTVVAGDARDLSICYRVLNGNTDNGKAITQTIITRELDFGDPFIDKIFDPCECIGNPGANAIYTIYMSIDRGSFTQLSSTMTGSTLLTTVFTTPAVTVLGTDYTRTANRSKFVGRGQTVRYKIVNSVYNTNPSFHQLQAYARPYGGRI